MRAWVFLACLLAACSAPPRVVRFEDESLRIESSPNARRDGNTTLLDHVGVVATAEESDVRHLLVIAFEDANGNGEPDAGEVQERFEAFPVRFRSFEHSGWRVQGARPWMRVVIDRGRANDPMIVSWALD